jgi:hypothetical protein
MKRILVLLIAVLLIFSIIGCSSEMDYIDNEPENQDDIQTLAAGDTPDRKIIYTVNASFDVHNLTDSIETMKSFVEDDEWFDYENISSRNATFTVRIKTERLDAFVDALKDSFQVRTYNKEGLDVSLNYQDKTNRITSINLQIERLQELYDNATLTEMMTINSQLANLEVELLDLEGDLSVYDSLIEYSEVNLSFYGSTVVTRSPFFNRLVNGFINGLKAMLTVLDGLAIGIANIIPFALVFGPIGYGVYILRKKYNLKKLTKIEEKKSDK